LLGIRPKICATVAEGTEEGMARSAVDAEGRGADLVELRLDWLPGLSEGSIERVFRRLEVVRVPKIATVMPSTIFGRYGGGGGDRVRLLMKAAEFVEYVDIGIEMGDAFMKQCLEGMENEVAEPVLSCHSEKMLSTAEIEALINSMPKRAVSKVVMPASSHRDNLLALDACASLEGRRRIVFCHGSLGAVSRVLCPLFGSEWTYASVAKGREGAPGQLDIATMRKIYEVFA
jgi:3-dehydroquinate dehydratase-1